jgi:peptidoglycan/LPS O-acetylase OafA/YrhL
MFNPRLESLRGIAALMVALGHSFLVVAIAQMENAYSVHYSDLNSWTDVATRSLFVLFNGGAAVSIFFVLSGYVLGLSLNKKALSNDSNTFLDSLGFVVRRLFRLFPAHIVSVSVIVASLYFFHEAVRFPVASSWFLNFYGAPLSMPNLIDNFLLLATNLNPVTWTLQVELLMSLLFPVAFLVCRSLSLKANVLALLLLAYFCAQLKDFYLLFSFVFYAGLVLSQLAPNQTRKMPASAVNVMLLLGLVALLGARVAVGEKSLFMMAAIECFGAVLIVFVLSNRLEGERLGAFLDHKLVRELGRISYSFYVLHFIVLYWVGYVALWNISPAWVNDNRFVFGLGMAATSIPLAVLIAKASYRWVEIPFVGFGSRVSKGLVTVLSSASSGIRLRLTAVSETTVLKRYPGLCYLLAAMPVLYFAQVSNLLGRSGALVPLNLNKHSFGFSDLAHFHVFALAAPLMIALACFHYLSRRPSFAGLIKYFVAYVTLGLALVSVHFFIALGGAAVEIYQWQELSKFGLAWLSSFGTPYYVCWSIALALIWVHLMVRLPSAVQFLLLAAMLPAVILLPDYVTTTSLPFLFAPWSPLNALPVASFVALLFGNTKVLDHARLGVIVALLASLGAAVYEWSFMLSESFAPSQLAALPVTARLSLYTSVFALLLLALTRRKEAGAFARMLAKCAIPALLLYPMLNKALISNGAKMAVDQVSFAHWSFTLLIFGLLIGGAFLWRLLVLLKVPVLAPARIEQ